MQLLISLRLRGVIAQLPRRDTPLSMRGLKGAPEGRVDDSFAISRKGLRSMTATPCGGVDGSRKNSHARKRNELSLSLAKKKGVQYSAHGPEGVRAALDKA